MRLIDQPEKDSTRSKAEQLAGLVKRIRKQHTVLVLGPQVDSYEPVLLEVLASECRIQSGNTSNSLPSVASVYAAEFTRTHLLATISQVLAGRPSTSASLALLSELPFSVAIVMRLDKAYEECLQSTGKQPIIESYSPQADNLNRFEATATEARPSTPMVWRLYGDADDGSLVVTEQDHHRFAAELVRGGKCDPVPLSIRFLLSIRSCFLVGCDLRDANLISLLMGTSAHQVDDLDRPIFIAGDSDALPSRVWQSSFPRSHFVPEEPFRLLHNIQQHLREGARKDEPH